MRKRKISVICLLAMLFGILSVSYVNPYTGEITLSELILQLSGSRGEFALGFSMSELLEFAMRMIPGWIVEAFLGIALYRHFCTASIYVFSRCADRKKWYWKEMGFLGADVLLFQSVTAASVIIVSQIRCEVKMNPEGMMLAMYHIFIHFLWIYSATVVINLLALKAGSSLAFAIVIFGQTFCIGLLNLVQMMDRFYTDSVAAKILLIKLNPVSHLVLGWHSSYIRSVDTVLKSFTGIPCDAFYAEVSLISLFLVTVMILKMGSIVIGKHDLLVSDAEMGVA